MERGELLPAEFSREFTKELSEAVSYSLVQSNTLSVYDICLTSLTRAKCGVRSTLCWKIPNISGSIELFAL